jgi:hypothetical protein
MNTGRRFLVLVFLGIGAVEAQTGGVISGRVLDAATKTPLPAANVVIKDTRYGAPSDSNGYFEIKDVPPGTYVIEFRYVGYKTRYRVVVVQEGAIVELNIELEQAAIPLPEVTVIDTAQVERLLHQYPRSQVITRGMLLETEARTVSSALQILAPRFDLAATRSSFRRTPRNPRDVPMQVRNILLLIDERRIYPTGDEIMNGPQWLDRYITIDEIEFIALHRGDDAWIRAGRRGERLDWLIEIKRRKP